MGDARIIDEALSGLIDAPDEPAVFAVVARAVHRLLPGSYIVASSVSPDETELRVAAVEGFDAVLGVLDRVLGFDPTAMAYPFENIRRDHLGSYHSGRLERLEGGLHTLGLGRIPRPAAAAIERLLHIDAVYAVGFAIRDSNYGALVLALPKGHELTDAETIETIVRQATVAVRRLRIEAELREKTEELDSFFSESLDLLCIADTRGYFRRLNPEWERTLGYPLAELEGHRFLDLVHPDDLPATMAAVHRLADGLAETSFVNRYLTRDGGYRWLEWRSFPRGDLIYAAARDLTRRIEAEQALRESEARYRLIADNTADVIWLMDIASGRFKYVSPSVHRLRGFTPEEVIAQPVESSLTPESFRQVSQGLPQLIAAVEAGDESRRVNVAEVDQPRKDGSIVATEVTSTLLSSADGRVVEVLGVSRDIAERKQAEARIKAINDGLEERVRERTAQLEEALGELESFSYSVSHDLRTPLRAINGYATILQEDHAPDLTEEGQRLCTSIVASTRRMGQLIDDLLAFSRLGRVQLASERVDMAALVRSVWEDIATEQQRSTVRFVAGDLYPATGDPLLLRQVWVNLIGNALKFSSGAEQPRIEVTCEKVGGGPGDLGAAEHAYSVRDNGVGFDTAYADRLFRVFERLHGSDYEGTGIGLAIVRRAVEAHGGRVWSASEPGRGATFSFALPAPQEG